MNKYVGSDGRRYSEEDIWRQLEDETWGVCCWDVDTGLQAFETDEEELLFLRPIDGTEPPLAGGRSEERL